MYKKSGPAGGSIKSSASQTPPSLDLPLQLGEEERRGMRGVKQKDDGDEEQREAIDYARVLLKTVEGRGGADSGRR